MINKIKTVIFLLGATFLMWQCGSDSLNIDVSSISVDVKVERMEQEVFDTLNVEDYEKKHQELYAKYGLLYKLFFERMIVEGSVEDPMAGVYLKQFSTDKGMQKIAGVINTKFNDFTKYQLKFEDAFKHYKYYFPDSIVPEIVTFYSNFNANVLPIDNQICIGLDMYLGKDNEIVKMLSPESIPQYLKDKMEDKFMVTDALKYFLLNKFTSNNVEQLDFLTTIIELGKIMYLVDALIPEEKDNIKMGYREESITWCKENEANIWKTIVEENLLYTKDQTKINQFIVDGPFTKGLPKESPSRVGVWMGWQMVRDYMAEKGITPNELLKVKDPKEILNYYNPNE